MQHLGEPCWFSSEYFVILLMLQPPNTSYHGRNIIRNLRAVHEWCHLFIMIASTPTLPPYLTMSSVVPSCNERHLLAYPLKIWRHLWTAPKRHEFTFNNLHDKGFCSFYERGLEVTCAVPSAKLVFFTPSPPSFNFPQLIKISRHFSAELKFKVSVDVTQPPGLFLVLHKLQRLWPLSKK